MCLLFLLGVAVVHNLQVMCQESLLFTISSVWWKQRERVFSNNLACEKALRGALAARRILEGALATTALAVEYLHRKSSLP